MFYHFVGAVPASTELEAMLKRLLKEMEVVDVSLITFDNCRSVKTRIFLNSQQIYQFEYIFFV